MQEAQQRPSRRAVFARRGLAIVGTAALTLGVGFGASSLAAAAEPTSEFLGCVPATITVEHRYVDSEELISSVAVPAVVDGYFVTEQLDPAEYNVAHYPEASEGYVTGDQTVEYQYHRSDDDPIDPPPPPTLGEMFVCHVDAAGNPIAPRDEFFGAAGDPWSSEPAEIEGYVLSSSPETPSGELPETTGYVVYTYVLEDDETTDGTTEGSTEGTTEGSTEGTTEGSTDGTTEGSTDGTTEGTTDGGTDGTTEGSTDGGTDGTTEGTSDGGTGGGTVPAGKTPAKATQLATTGSSAGLALGTAGIALLAGGGTLLLARRRTGNVSG